MIDRIETQQQDHQQYTERKQYKAIGTVSAIPSTNRTYLEWVELDKSLPRQEPRTYLQAQSTDVEKCGYHVIHDEGKPTERHEWLLKEHFDSSYRLAENHGSGTQVNKSFDWAEWEEYKDDPHHFSPEYKAYVKEQISIFGELANLMSPDLFNAGAMLTEKLAGSQGENMKRSVTGNSAQASNGDAVTYDIKESLKAQFNKIKDTGDKTQLKQEIDRAQAMISLAQAINSFK